MPGKQGGIRDAEIAGDIGSGGKGSTQGSDEEMIKRRRGYSFGRYTINGLSVTALASRYFAGESMKSIAEDFSPHITRSQVKEAVDFIRRRRKSGKR